MIEEYKNINKNLIIQYEKADNKEKLKRHMLIEKIFSDKLCFFKLPITDAFSILQDLGIREEDIESKYKELISYANFKNIEN